MNKAFYKIKTKDLEDQDSDYNIFSTSGKYAMSCKQSKYVLKSYSEIECHKGTEQVWKCDLCDAEEFDQYDLEHHVEEKH